MTSTRSEGVRQQRHALVPGLTLSVALPAQARVMAPRPIDTGAMPAAELLLHRAYALPHGASVELACASADPGVWIDGLAPVVLGGASALARAQLGLAALAVGPLQTDGALRQQAFSGTAASPGSATARGSHLLAFAGVEHRPVLCTVACVAHPAGAGCARVIASATLVGELVGPPPPGPLARAVTTAAAHPGAVWLGVAVLLASAAAWLLARRPRPHW